VKWRLYSSQRTESGIYTGNKGRKAKKRLKTEDAARLVEGEGGGWGEVGKQRIEPSKSGAKEGERSGRDHVGPHRPFYLLRVGAWNRNLVTINQRRKKKTMEYFCRGSTDPRPMGLKTNL